MAKIEIQAPLEIYLSMEPICFTSGYGDLNSSQRAMASGSGIRRFLFLEMLDRGNEIELATTIFLILPKQTTKNWLPRRL